MNRLPVLIIAYLASLAFQASAQDAAPKPPYERLLQGEDAKKAEVLEKKIDELQAADDYAGATRAAEEHLALRNAAQGADHWETVSAKWWLDQVRKIGALTPEQRADWRKARQGGADAIQLRSKGEYAKAQALSQEFSRWCEQVLGKDPQTVGSYNSLARNLVAQRKYAEAQPLLQKALDHYQELVGERHPYTAASCYSLADNLDSQRKYAEAQPLYQKSLDIRRELYGEKNSQTAIAYHNLALNLDSQRKYAEAQLLYEKSLAIRLELSGEKNKLTATTYHNLAMNLDSQGKYGEALPLYQKSLEIRRALFGEKHADTASSYSALGLSLNEQAKYADAQPLLQKALDLYRELNGEKHSETAEGYNTVGLCMKLQGKYAEAQPLYQKAFEIRRELHGEKHADTAQSYNNLGLNLKDQGKYAEAQPLLQKALDTFRELFGEQHVDTANCYNSLAMNLSDQQRHAEAQPLFQKALDLNREVLGEHDPNTANSYNSLAYVLTNQGKYSEARPLFQKALELRRAHFGEKHRDTARTYGNIGTNLHAQGQYAEAQPYYQKALNLHRELFGEQHPDTTKSYNNLALNLHVQKEYAAAQATLERAIHSYEASRLSGASGLDRATLRNTNPRLLLAALQARSEPAVAWLSIELTLARGLLDQQAAQREAGLLTPAELADQNQWQKELAVTQSQMLGLIARSQRTKLEVKQLDALAGERREAEQRLAALAVRVSQREVAPASAIRTALGSDAALVFWVDVSDTLVDTPGPVQEHWGCILRSTGEPQWERLPGTGSDKQWTQSDARLPAQLREVLAGNAAASEIATLTNQLNAQRLAPLVKHLTGVQKLYVVPVGEMAGIPVEALTANYSISYVPSGTFLARLNDLAKPAGNTLLALADPIFNLPGERPPVATVLPPGGLLLTFVAPGGAADQALLKAGDVLLKYGDTELTDLEKLKTAVAASATAKTIPVTIWREDADQPLVRDLSPGKLGVVLAKDPAPLAIANRRQSDALLLALRSGDWSDLPGTRIEASRIGRLFGDGATVLADSTASEQRLEAIRQAGNLQTFRYLHFATHGEGNNVRAFASALILAQDSIPQDASPQSGQPYLNGQLSASEVLEYWKLNADLVTLSACESAVGPLGGGDGPLGFAQAFLTAGSRSVCLSLWKVDDTATTLLMDRFYQNLLGKRPGLEEPLGKAAALAEAKNWLRNLSTDEALQLTADMTKGVVRGKGQKALTLVAVPKPDDPAAARDFKPFGHPRYWAAFILIGDPD